MCTTLFQAGASTVTDGDSGKNERNKEAAGAVAKQTWEFYSALAQPTAEELAAAQNHKLGKEVGCLYGKFMDMYVVKEEVVPGDPARRTVIRKPGIYNAVRSIEKQLNREVKREQLTKEAAATEFTEVLKVALAALDSDSESFENALQENKKDTPHLLALFDSVQLKRLY